LLCTQLHAKLFVNKYTSINMPYNCLTNKISSYYIKLEKVNAQQRLGLRLIHSSKRVQFLS